MTGPVRATYRLQLGAGFGFDEAAALVPYLQRLGVSHLYLSPVLQAAPGSTHGYDIVDPSRLSSELGGEEGFARLAAAVRARGLGLVLDIVPHHLAIAGRANRWWWDVLTYGRVSRYAWHFDIDWNHPEERLRDRVILPVLGDHYGSLLEGGGIHLVADPVEIAVVDAGGAVVPLSPEAIGTLVADVGGRAGDDELALLGRALVRSGEPIDVVVRDVEVVRRRLVERRGDADVDRALQAAIVAVNVDRDHLHELLERQHYRLVRWQSASHELDYRRFFDVNSLIALRSERPAVFEETHAKVLDLVDRGDVDGLRVDHVDGLLDPEGYLKRLRTRAPTAWIVVEKILAVREPLRRSWPVDGTTGYDFAALTTPLLVDPAGEATLTRAYQEITGDRRGWHEHAVEATREILAGVLAADVERLTTLLVQIGERERRMRDYTRSELRGALVEVAAHTDAYRSYGSVTDAGEVRVSDADRAYVESAVAAVAADGTADPELLRFLAGILSFGRSDPDSLELAVRFQQLTGPARAKGEEDTALYRYTRLLALCDVGHDPARFSVGTDELHGRARATLAEWPATMLTTSTHDTKRSEDVRARLAGLGEHAERWEQAMWRWLDLGGPCEPPDGRIAWFVLQTLAGVWPIEEERLLPVLEKSFREAKVFTSWLRPDAEREREVAAWVRVLLTDERMRSEIEALVSTHLDPVGRANSLLLVALRATMPGIPDTYRGTEAWDFSLVDPDNRRPLDVERLTAWSGRQRPADAWSRDAGAKQSWLAALLALRARRPEVFPGGAYEPLAGGSEADRLVAYLRGGEVAVVGRRFPSRGDEGEWVELPAGAWADLATGTALEGGRRPVAELLAAFPVAVLERR